MTKKTKIFVWLCIWSLNLSLAIFLANFTFAQDFGVNAVNEGLEGTLTSADPRLLVGRIIQIALSFLGVIAIVLIMYAGFLWMTSGGEEEKMGRAKKILLNSVIGLIIILSAWAITTFVISRLSGAAGGGPGSQVPAGGNVLTTPGLGAFGACSVESSYPSPGQRDVPRNTAIMVTFKEELKLETVCQDSSGNSCACGTSDCNKINPVAIRLFKTDLGDSCSDFSCPNPNGNNTEIAVSVSSDNKTLVLTPIEFLGSVNGETPYTIKFSNRLQKKDGSSMFKNCSSDLAEWDFLVSNSLDLEPPLVALAGIFPLPDNEKDLNLQVVPATPAFGSITVNSCPQVYSAAILESVTPSSASVTLNYQGALEQFKVSVPAGSPNKAQLFDGNNNLLGLADFSSSGAVTFPNFLTLSAENHPEGSLWTISLTPEKLADTLRINDEVYVFAKDSLFNNIRVPDSCLAEGSDDNQAVEGESQRLQLVTEGDPLTDMAASLQAKISGHPDINVNRENETIAIRAKVAGMSGNGIILETSNPAALAIQPMSGGADRKESNEPRDKKDRPMNSALQLNFNESVNPLTVSGTALEVKDYIRVVNARATSSPAGAVCALPADCRSYKCENNTCVGDFLGGKFTVSNNYRTVEFLSDKECGLNGCGEKIYCLPANSHLAVELQAADLKTCSSSSDCLAYAPFSACLPTAFSYKTCQNPDGKNYPSANISALTGIIDAAANSLDGNRDEYADGPLDFYNDNYAPPVNIGKKDKFKWSFFINNQIMLTPPQISDISPSQAQQGASTTAPIRIRFNTLMLNSSLRSGSTIIKSGTTTQVHKLINLRSLSPSPLGYWLGSENLDIDPLDGEPDITVANISHSTFSESLTFNAQVGSGVKDIYQNCYKPSAGPDCLATPDLPSCCYGNPTSVLNPEGSCQ